MLIQQVRYFLALCDEGNFTRAAERCDVAQPTVTNAIRSMERELGGALFYRKPQVALTPLGHAVRPHLCEIVAAADLAYAAARKANHCHAYDHKKLAKIVAHDGIQQDPERV